MKKLFMLGLMLVLVANVNSLCFDLIKQYFSCKHLNMTPTKWFGMTKYVPVRNISNNTLPDSFFEQNLPNDQPMALLEQIYSETDETCTSEFCECVRSDLVNAAYLGNHSVFFRRRQVFPQAKSIIADFASKFKSQLKPTDEIDYFISREINHTLPSLAKFCVDLEFTSSRPFFYSNISDCYEYNKTIYDSCMWSATVANRTLLVNSKSPAMLKKELTCKLLFVTKCPVEQQRFVALTSWAEDFAALKPLSLTSFFDQLVLNASAFKPEFIFAQQRLFLDGDGEMIYVDSFKSGVDLIYSNHTTAGLDVLRSDFLNIRLQLNVSMFRYCLIFRSSNQTSKQMVFNITVSKEQQAKNNGTVIQGDDGVNLAEIVQTEDDRIEVYDFGSNSHVWLDAYAIRLASPVESVWMRSTGILADVYENATTNATTSGSLENLIVVNVEFENNKNDIWATFTWSATSVTSVKATNANTTSKNSIRDEKMSALRQNITSVVSVVVKAIKNFARYLLSLLKF